MTPGLRDWTRRVTGLENFDLAAVLIDDLHIDQQVQQNLKNTFADHDFCSSFGLDQIILSLEVLNQQHLIDLQKWLASQCCCIERYHVIVIGELGISRWWQSYTAVMNLRSFQLVEVLDLPFGSKSLRESWSRSHSWFREFWYADIPDRVDLDRDLHHHFLYLPGGSSACLETGLYKDYLACRMSELPSGLVDLRYILRDANDLANWTDCESGWQDQAAVDHIRDLRLRLGSKHGSPVVYDRDLYSRTLDLYTHTFATVARESLMAQPWSCCGEKTLRPFMLGQFVIPTTIDAVSRLEDLGFWFDHSWFDFSYQKEKNLMVRTHHLLRSLGDLVTRDLQECRQHLQQHRARYQSNSELARQLTRLYSV